MEKTLHDLEVLAESLIVSDSNAKRALEVLQIFSTVEYIPQCKYIIDNSKSQSAIYFAATALHACISNHWMQFNQDLNNSIELRNYLLIYLWAKGGEFQPFSLNAIIKLICVVVKLGWSNEAQQNFVEQVEKFLQSSIEHRIIGLKLLEFIIEEFSTKHPSQTYAAHRKMSNLFRDHSLVKIFDISIELLQLIRRDQNQVPNSIQEMTFKLFIQCLSFDFFATLSYSNEDTYTIQIPSAWKSKFEDGNIVILQLDLFTQQPNPPRSCQILECISLLSSVRTSLFTSGDTRSQYIFSLLRTTTSILQSGHALSDSDNHHQFCRILARLKANFQLNQLAQVDGFVNWLIALREFTFSTFHSYKYSQNSILYLLSFWSKTVSSVDSIHESSGVSDCAFQVACNYLISKIRQGNSIIDDDLLDDEEQLEEQLDTLPLLLRTRYAEFSSELIKITEPLIIQYQSAIQSRNSNQIPVIESQLSWIFYIVGAAVGGRTTTMYLANDLIDIELSVLIFKFLSVQDLRYQINFESEHLQHLEMAIIYFLSNFKRVFIEKSQISTDIFMKLKEKMGIDNMQVLTELLIRKVVTNVTIFAKQPEIITKTLKFFYDLVCAISPKVVASIELVKVLLSRHTAQHFPFLNVEENFVNRSKYYHSLTRLLFMNNVHPDRFEEFMLPFRSTFEFLTQSTVNVDTLRQADYKKCFVGLLRDLIGVAAACNSKPLYDMLFEWLFPKYIDIIAKCSAIFYDEPRVIAPLLRFAVQLTTNKDGRLKFDCSSQNGFLLFREIGKIVIEYGRRLLGYTPDDQKLYDHKLKGIVLILTIMDNMSTGNYIPFCVFDLYGDSVLSDSLNISLQLSLSISLDDIMSFSKLTPAYYSFLNALSQKHIKFLVSLDAQTFAKILINIKEGIIRIAPDTGEFQKCIQFLEALATYYYFNVNKDKDYIKNFKMRITESSSIISPILGTLFHLSIFSDNANHWEISKCLFTLIITHPQLFTSLREEIVNSQLPEKRSTLIDAFTVLMRDVEMNLDSHNKDLFSKNFTTFRSHAKKCLQSDT